MSTLTGKSFGFGTDAAAALQAHVTALEAAGVTVDLIPLHTLTSATTLSKYDALLLDFVHSEHGATSALDTLYQAGITKTLPVFAVVPQLTTEEAEIAFEHGAADVLSLEQGATQLTQKIAEYFGAAPVERMDAHTIDITVSEVAPTVSGTKVFFIEDDPLIHTLLETKFTQLGFSCAFSVDGVDVLTKIAAFKPDVIILDLMLPGVDGLDILAELKTSPTVKDIPVVIFSNRDEQADRKRANDLGAARYHVKATTDLVDLVQEVRDLASVA